MKALSIHQPWAWAILHAGKNVENRSWGTNYRGPLLIHAAKSRVSYDHQDAKAWRDRYGVELPAWDELPTGAILGVVEIVDCERSECDVPGIGACVWADPDSWCWVLQNPKTFRESIRYPGAQKLFDVPDEILPVEAVR